MVIIGRYEKRFFFISAEKRKERATTSIFRNLVYPECLIYFTDDPIFEMDVRVIDGFTIYEKDTYVGTS